MCTFRAQWMHETSEDDRLIRCVSSSQLRHTQHMCRASALNIQLCCCVGCTAQLDTDAILRVRQRESYIVQTEQRQQRESASDRQPVRP